MDEEAQNLDVTQLDEQDETQLDDGTEHKTWMKRSWMKRHNT